MKSISCTELTKIGLILCFVSILANAKDCQDIVTIASNTDSLKTLFTAVKNAELVDTLKGAGPLTVFAPNDEAFAKLGDAGVKLINGDRTPLRQALLPSCRRARGHLSLFSHLPSGG